MYYDPPRRRTSRICQGELLANVTEFLATPHGDGDGIDFEDVTHEYAFVVTADCDLEQDHRQRENNPDTAMGHGQLLPVVLMCSAFSASTVVFAERFDSKRLRERLEKLEFEKYHHIPANRDETWNNVVPDLVIDFKRVIAVPPARLHADVLSRRVRRVAMLPDQEIAHLTHRFFNFQGRFGRGLPIYT